MHLDYSTKANLRARGGGRARRRQRRRPGAVTATDANSNSYASGLGFGADGHSGRERLRRRSRPARVTEAELRRTRRSSRRARRLVQRSSTTTSACSTRRSSEPVPDRPRPARDLAQRVVRRRLLQRGHRRARTRRSTRTTTSTSGAAPSSPGLEGVDLLATYNTVRQRPRHRRRLVRALDRPLRLRLGATRRTTPTSTTRSRRDADARSITAGPRAGTTENPRHRASDRRHDRPPRALRRHDERLDRRARERPRQQALARGRQRRRGTATTSRPIASSTSNGDVTILSGRSPYLEIDSQRQDHEGDRDRRSATTAACTTTPLEHRLPDASRHDHRQRHRQPGPGQGRCSAHRPGRRRDGSTSIDGHRRHLDVPRHAVEVRIINNSAQDIQINDIRVANAAKPEVSARARRRRRDTPLTFHDQARGAFRRSSGSRTRRAPTSMINGTIDNPIGTT